MVRMLGIAFCYFVAFISFVNTLPLTTHTLSKINNDLKTDLESVSPIESKYSTDNVIITEIKNEVNSVLVKKKTLTNINDDLRNVRQNTLRPGLTIRDYHINLSFEDDVFNGRLEFRAFITTETRGNPLILHTNDLSITSVFASVTNEENAVEANFEINNGRLIIRPQGASSSYLVIIEYSGPLRNDGWVLYSGFNNAYLAMNLHPTNARRVFPCIDEPTETPLISFTINDVTYQNLISNSMPVINNPNSFRALSGAPFRWALFGHNFTTYNVPIANVQLYGRPNLAGQDNIASLAINSYYLFLQEWTNKPYFEILVDQTDNMHIIALPDVDVEWNSLSIVGLWEPYLFMNTPQYSVQQKQIALIKIAEAITRPWFGFTLIAENWIYQWVIRGLQTYAAYEAVKEFEGENEFGIDFNTIFVTDVIQESLLRDGYASASVLEPAEYIYNEVDIRNHISNGLMKYKAPAILSMLRLVLDEENDFIEIGAQGLFVASNLDIVNTFNFRDIINDPWSALPDRHIGDLEVFLDPYIKQRGCPLLTVNYQSNLVTISRGTFNYGGQVSETNFFVPITYTTSKELEFDNVYPKYVYQDPTSRSFQVELDDDDYIIFNIQGRGYYRVQYNTEMWERIIAALEDPERREEIHPLNRAVLVDDSLNLAKRIVSGLNYDIALRIAFTMELEKEYPVWKSFIRNMNYLKKRLLALVEMEEGLDPDIYLRMIRRTVATVENELTFSPDPNSLEPAMDTLTRGIVMDHVCRAGYDPCIAAAIDWFYNGNDEVNPNIPHDLRPAVYCAVVQGGGEDEREMLFGLLEEGTETMQDRVVILEALGCSQDEDFILEYLDDTVSDDSPYSTAEKLRIFKAVIESSFNNARIAIRFLRDNIDDIRQQYGGPAKLEELIFIVADNIAHHEMAGDFRIWLENNNNHILDSVAAAEIAMEIIEENMDWADRHLQGVYDWIEENDSTTAALSLFLLCLTAVITLLNS